MKFLGRPFWLMAVFVFTTKKLPILDGLSASLKTDSTAALRTVAATSPPRHLPDKRSSIEHGTQMQTAHTPTRRHANTASFVVAASPRCGLLRGFFLRDLAKRVGTRIGTGETPMIHWTHHVHK